MATVELTSHYTDTELENDSTLLHEFITTAGDTPTDSLFWEERTTHAHKAVERLVEGLYNRERVLREKLGKQLEETERAKQSKVQLVRHQPAKDPLWDRIFVETMTDMNQAAGIVQSEPTDEDIRKLAQLAALVTQRIYAEAVKVRDAGTWVEK